MWKKNSLKVLGLYFLMTIALAACSVLPTSGTPSTPTVVAKLTTVPTQPIAPAIPTVTVTNANQLLNANLILNGNAEAGPGSPDDTSLVPTIPGWTRNNSANVMQYQSQSGSFLAITDSGPSDRGKNFFYGGTDAISPTKNATTSSLSQVIDVSLAAPLFSTSAIKYTLSAWLGGYSSQNDNARLTIQFLSIAGQAVGTASVGPVLAADRDNTDALVQRSTTGAIPASTTKIIVTLTFTRTDGIDNDGSADDLSLTLHP
jgi:hypothetical protein